MLLLLKSGSKVDAVTKAVLRAVNACVLAGMVTLTNTRATSPARRLTTSQSTRLLTVGRQKMVPFEYDDVTDTMLNRAGTGSVMTTAIELLGPALAMLIW